MLQVNLGNNRFSLTDNFMDTIIEDLENPENPKAIVLNNLAICSLAERGNQFCFEFSPQNGGCSHFQAVIFNLRAEFYSDGTIVLISMLNPQRIKTHLKYIIDYYNNVLCNIIIKEKMENATDFTKNEKDKIQKIKNDDQKTK